MSSSALGRHPEERSEPPLRVILNERSE